MDGFSIEKFKKKHESFGHSPAKFESGTTRFSGEKPPQRWSCSNLAPTLVLLLRGTVNSELEIFKIAQNTIYEVKERQYCAGKVRQRLFRIVPCTYLSTYRYTEETNGESNTFIIKLQRLHKQILWTPCG